MLIGQTNGDIIVLGNVDFVGSHRKMDVLCRRCGRTNHVAFPSSKRCNSCTQKVRNRRKKFFHS